MLIRQQLSAYSPLSLRAVVAAVLRTTAHDRDSRIPLVRELRDTYKASAVVLYGSGTQALQCGISLSLHGAPPDAVVAMPAFACYDVASAAVGSGYPVALYDVCPDSLAPDLESLERVLQGGARAVIIAPLYGVPVPWKAIRSLASRYGAVLIEDAAQGNGAVIDAKPLGSLGDISVISFGRGKGWTGGGGGALLLRDTASPASHLTEHGALTDLHTLPRVLAQWLLGRPSLYRLPLSIPELGLGETTFKPPSIPHGMTRFSAELLLRLHDQSTAEARERKRRAAIILRGIQSSPNVRFIRPPTGSDPGYLRLPVRLPRGMASLADPAYARRLGVASSYPTTLAALPVLRPLLRNRHDRWPGAEQLVRELITLPTHSLLRCWELNAIAELIGRL